LGRHFSAAGLVSAANVGGPINRYVQLKAVHENAPAFLFVGQGRLLRMIV
jgi:hypothetical protein